MTAARCQCEAGAEGQHSCSVPLSPLPVGSALRQLTAISWCGGKLTSQVRNNRQSHSRTRAATPSAVQSGPEQGVGKQSNIYKLAPKLSSAIASEQG
jgi:hypothetical protein